MAIYDVQGNLMNIAYNVSSIETNTAYDISGNVIFNHADRKVDYDDYTLDSSFNISVANCQGIAVYNDVLFQFRANGSSVTDTVCLFDYTDGSDIFRNMSIESDHGDSASFSNEFYSENDEFPLIYVTADTTPAKIYVDRVTRSNASLIRTLLFPQSAGYYGAGAFDFDNSICYLLSYKQNNYTSDNGGANTTVISKWDISDLTDNGDGTFTPAFITQYERPFIYVMQGLTYHDGMIWVTSGYGNAPSNVYALSPSDGALLHTITMNDNTEIEGVQFIYDNYSGSYYMLIGQQSGKYKKYTFGTI